MVFNSLPSEGIFDPEIHSFVSKQLICGCEADYACGYTLHWVDTHWPPTTHFPDVCAILTSGMRTSFPGAEVSNGCLKALAVDQSYTNRTYE